MVKFNNSIKISGIIVFIILSIFIFTILFVFYSSDIDNDTVEQKDFASSIPNDANYIMYLNTTELSTSPRTIEAVQFILDLNYSTYNILPENIKILDTFENQYLDNKLNKSNTNDPIFRLRTKELGNIVMFGKNSDTNIKSLENKSNSGLPYFGAVINVQIENQNINHLFGTSDKNDKILVENYKYKGHNIYQLKEHKIDKIEGISIGVINKNKNMHVVGSKDAVIDSIDSYSDNIESKNVSELTNNGNNQYVSVQLQNQNLKLKNLKENLNLDHNPTVESANIRYFVDRKINTEMIIQFENKKTSEKISKEFKTIRSFIKNNIQKDGEINNHLVDEINIELNGNSLKIQYRQNIDNLKSLFNQIRNKNIQDPLSFLIKLYFEN